MDTLNQNTEIP
jgi:hypothetical protein